MDDAEREWISSITMLTMMNDSDIAMKFRVTIRILFVFGRIVKTPYSVQP